MELALPGLPDKYKKTLHNFPGATETTYGKRNGGSVEPTSRLG
jgi:hypothetical protein